MMGTSSASRPSLSALYGKALLSPLRWRTRSTTSAAELPRDRHRVEGLSADPERIREFQRLMGGGVTDFLPSGYLHTLAFPTAVSVLARADFPLPLLGMVHLRNDIEHLRPVGVNSRLAVTAWVENLRTHRSGAQVDAVVEVESSDGVVWRGRSTYLAKGIRISGEAPGGAADRPAGTDIVPDYPTTIWKLEADTGRRYAAVSGDYNPIHLTTVSARLLGLKQPIAHGMYLASRMITEAGPPETVPFRWTIEFHSPVTLPSTVALAVSPRDEGNGTWRGTDVTAWNPRRRRRLFTGSLQRLDGEETSDSGMQTGQSR